MDLSDDGGLAHGKFMDDNGPGLSRDATQTKVRQIMSGAKLPSNVNNEPVMMLNATPKPSQVSLASPSILGESEVLPQSHFELFTD